MQHGHHFRYIRVVYYHLFYPKDATPLDLCVSLVLNYLLTNYICC